MDQQQTDPATELKRLQRCMNDLVSVLALPAVWNVSESRRILETFLDALMGILDLDFLYARVQLGSHEPRSTRLGLLHSSGRASSRKETEACTQSVVWRKSAAMASRCPRASGRTGGFGIPYQAGNRRRARTHRGWISEARLSGTNREPGA